MSTMKIQFESNQTHQTLAISALVDIFKGQAESALTLTPMRPATTQTTQGYLDFAEQGVGNWIQISPETLNENIRAIQEANDLPPTGLTHSPEWTLHDPHLDHERDCHQLTIEMETGTGKTYVFLRTIMELAQRYGFRKFVIVVPSIAIREGTLKSLKQLKEHFATLYTHLHLNHFVYDSRNLNRLREFTAQDSLQVMVINIQAFARDVTNDDDGGNIIYRPSEDLSGRRPIDLITTTRPIIIIDEPQSVVNSNKSKEAIKRLNPLLVARYSATHKERHNLLYRLDPIAAFEQRLVKQIWVSEVRVENDTNEALVILESATNTPHFSARIKLYKKTQQETKLTTITVRQHDDLFEKSGHLPAYSGYTLQDIDATPGQEAITFTNGVEVRVGAPHGTVPVETWRAQIHKTIEHHLEKMLENQSRGLAVKVLSLFFIDRVANYRVKLDDPQDQGKFARAFEESFRTLSQEARFSTLPIATHTPDQVHAGYFSGDKKERKDTSGNTNDDRDTYALIMRDKERLLDPDEPVHFIFSHSALREGWDNPNVFQICTLNETTSEMKKRQEIGRGLRVPVDKDGKRVFDDTLNQLTIITNESYTEFAEKLQTEYVEEGVEFGKLPAGALNKHIAKAIKEELFAPQTPDELTAWTTQVEQALRDLHILSNTGRISRQHLRDARDNRTLEEKLPDHLSSGFITSILDLCDEHVISKHIKKSGNRHNNPIKKELLIDPRFTALWDKIKPRTTYALKFDTQALIERIATELAQEMQELAPPQITLRQARVEMSYAGVKTKEDETKQGTQALKRPALPIPDVLSYLAERTDLTRHNIADLLARSGTLDKLRANPQGYLDIAQKIIQRTLGMVAQESQGVAYTLLAPPAEECWRQEIFEAELPLDTSDENANRFIEVQKSLYRYISCDSTIERDFAKALDARDDIELFFKLPRSFKIDTPVGRYNPDWAIVLNNGEQLYLVRETKGTIELDKLRFWQEKTKILCGAEHFKLLGVDYGVVVKADEVTYPHPTPPTTPAT